MSAEKSPTVNNAQAAIAAEQNAPAGSRQGCFPIVGVGASAGGLDAYREFLSHLSPDTGMAFVLIQHLAPDHESMLPELLAPVAKMPVVQAKDGMRLEPDHVYIIPPAVSMTVKDGVLKLGPRVKDDGKLRCVDLFFSSISQQCGNRAIGVVFSGTGFDGTAGVAAIKSEGGMTFAQDERSAKFDGMPRSAVISGFIDAVLPPAEIAQELSRIASSFDGSAGDEEILTETDEVSLRAILQIVKAQRGVDFTAYKPSTIRRRIFRRAVLTKQGSLAEYAELLPKNTEELETLFRDLLINVTEFFRNPEEFEALHEIACVSLVSRRAPNHPVRVWVPGCSTGQEAYSIAMLLFETMGKMGVQLTVQIFGTDLSEAALEKARSGLYTAAQVEGLSKERLRRFFNEEDGGFRVCKSVREACVFARHNLISDPPFSRMDLVSCRNLLIYLGPTLQRKVFPIFHYALNPDGYLFLGTSETVGEFTSLFLNERRNRHLFRKKTVAGQPRPSFATSFEVVGSSNGPRGGLNAIKSMGPHTAKAPDTQREADRLILAKYGPPGVVLNSQFDVVQFRGSTSNFLEPMSGKASFNVLKMAREGLLVPLRSALQRAKKTGKPIHTAGVSLRINGREEKINLEVVPLEDASEGSFLVLFDAATLGRVAQRREVREAARRARGAEKDDPIAEIERLQAELAATKDFLQAAIEQSEAANEELQASSEEAQSSN